jgi:hypothetical protein
LGLHARRDPRRQRGSQSSAVQIAARPRCIWAVGGGQSFHWTWGMFGNGLSLVIGEAGRIAGDRRCGQVTAQSVA